MALINKHPALLVRCADVSDVIRSIQFARSQHLPVAVRGGGHSYADKGTSDDSLVIDLSPMKRVQVDPVKRIAQAQAGLLLGVIYPRDGGFWAGHSRRELL